jgi:hypothetical protein
MNKENYEIFGKLNKYMNITFYIVDIFHSYNGVPLH